jgi:hypothetical protein
MATPTKLKVTIDVNSTDVERAMAAFVRADNNPDLVALTDPAVVLIMSRYQPPTFLLPRLARDVGGQETDFLAVALSSASSKQARDKLRLLYAHRREGGDVFVSDDTETFGAPESEQRQRVNGLALPASVMSTDEFERYCQARQTTGRWG